MSKKKISLSFHQNKSEKVPPKVQFQQKASVKPKFNISSYSYDLNQNESAIRFVLMVSLLPTYWVWAAAIFFSLLQ